MDKVIEWVIAVLVLGTIVGLLFVVGTFLAGTAAVLVVALIIAAGLDVILTPFRWISSLSSSTKEKRMREEDV